MKKLFSVILALVMTFSLAASVSANAPLTSADALNVLRGAAGLINLTPEQRTRYDMNNDGEINTADAVAILRVTAGLPAFPTPMPGNSSGNTMNAGFAANDSEWVYYSCFGAVNRVRADGSGRQQLTFQNRRGVSTNPNMAHINLVNNRLFFMGIDGSIPGIYRMDTDGSNLTLVTAFENRPADVAMTVAGDWIYYTDTRNNSAGGGLYRIRTDGTRRERLLDRREFPGLRFSLVGDWIYFIGTRHIERVRVDGTGRQTVIFASEDNTIAHMAIGNNRIFYTDNRRTGTADTNVTFPIHTLHSAALDGTNSRVVLNAVENINHLNIDGGWIYFSERNTHNNEQNISRVRIDGTEKTTIVSDIHVSGICVVGLRIYYHSDATLNLGMFRVPITGGSPTKIA
jgi:hypothetical protein